MKKIIKYLFYRLFLVSLSNGEQDSGWALTIVSLFIMSNAYSAFDMILILTHTPLPQMNTIPIVCICMLIFYFNYSILTKNGKSKLILKEFENEKQSVKNARTAIIFLYIVVSILLFIYTGSLVRNMRV